MLKQLSFILIILVTIQQGKAQFNNSTPWMQELKKKSNKEKHTLEEISNAFNAYWKKNKELKDKKGSGYKPFKRWEHRWKSSIDKEGYIASPSKIWKAWEEKNILQRSSNDASNWQNIGPFTQESKSGQGRINTFIVDPNNPDIYYVGAPAGGIWKSIDRGQNWTPMSDYLPQIGVSGIVIDHTNSDIIYIATGDDDGNDSYSVGVLKSIDGGLTWNTTSLQFFNQYRNSNEIYMHPDNNEILWVATNHGLYKTVDAGVNWEVKLHDDIEDFKIKPNNPNIIYAVSNRTFYKSTDGGETFEIITNGLPSSSSRLVMDVTQANEDLVFVLSVGIEQGLYKSTNSGDSFTKTLENDDIINSVQTWFNLALAVSDTNEDIIHVGALDIWRSVDGGDNFSQLNYWFEPTQSSYTHADIHFLRYFNGNLYCGSDGGIYKSTDDGNNFFEMNDGLAISQYYRVAVSRQSSNNIAGGLQDNGGFAYSNDTWYKYLGGDGMDCAIDPNNPNIYYGFSQNGTGLTRTLNGGIDSEVIATAPEAGNWITPLNINSNGELYAGYKKLYKLDQNNNWEQISEQISQTDAAIRAFEIDPNDETIFYLSIGNKLYKSINNGADFVEILQLETIISSIEVNNNNSNIIYLTTRFANEGKVYKSIDQGVTFTDITGNLPNEPKLVIKHHPYSPLNDVYIGTELGVYHINDNMTNWESYSTNLPNVQITDLEINIFDKIITASTYGRGVWQSPIEVEPPSNDIRLVSINHPSTHLNCDDTIVPEIMVKNEGQNAITQITINYELDDVEQEMIVLNTYIVPQGTQIIALPELLELNLGEHQLKINATIANDTFDYNNSLTVDFLFNTLEVDPTVINPFENVNNSWLVSNDNVWEIGTPNTPILGNTNSTGYVTNVSGLYPHKTVSYLTSPCYDLTGISNPMLKFDMAFDIELNNDVLYVEYSIDNGQNWQVLGTANDPNWYNSDFYNGYLAIGKQWTGRDETLKEYSYNLTPFTNQTNILFRFTFLTNIIGTREGILIDNFVIEGNVLSQQDTILSNLIVYPNPTSDFLTIKRNTSDEIKVSIFNIAGNLIQKAENITTTNYQLNLKGLENGVYFVSIISEKYQTVRKVILKK